MACKSWGRRKRIALSFVRRLRRSRPAESVPFPPTATFNQSTCLKSFKAKLCWLSYVKVRPRSLKLTSGRAGLRFCRTALSCLCRGDLNIFRINMILIKLGCRNYIYTWTNIVIDALHNYIKASKWIRRDEIFFIPTLRPTRLHISNLHS